MLGVLAATAALVLSGQADAATCAPWRNVSIPDAAGAAGMLSGVAAHSAGNAMAVGDGGQHAFALRWRADGPWRGVDVPERGSESELSGVARIPGTNNYWGVGSYETNAGETRSHIVRWTGSEWIVVPSPSVAGFATTLSGVTALSATNAWAVGSYGDALPFPGEVSAYTLVLRWNGTRWRIVESPSPLPPSADDPSDTPFDHLKDVLAVSSGALWTVGDMAYDPSRDDGWPLVMRRQAADWRMFLLPQRASEDRLESISALSPRDIWTVGWAFDDADASIEPLAFHWNGQSWTETVLPFVPQQGDDDQTSLHGVESVSPSKTWAVGQDDRGLDTGALVLRWNGTAWRTVSNDGPPNSRLLDVTHVPNTEITWAVGWARSATIPLIWRHC
jgi:hypothetical protein